MWLSEERADYIVKKKLWEYKPKLKLLNNFGITSKKFLSNTIKTLLTIH